MKDNSRLYALIITVFSSAFLMVNLKRHLIDEMWDTFFLIQIFFLNFIQLFTFLKEKQTEKKANKA